jgi:predicted ATP-grasp superfamily ATP-dependent carboligase
MALACALALRGEGVHTLVVAAISARTLAESAAQAGWRVVALDLFGDLDTRLASARWAQIGDPATLVIDAQRLRTALEEAAREPGVIGWVAGSGFEAMPSLLDAGPASLPRLGMASDAVRALRDPRHFFATLDRLNLPHPAIALDAPADATGWLVKRSGGTGGWHIRDAAHASHLHPDSYFQRTQDGAPMSALFLADGISARLVALNHLTVRALGSHPHVYRGAIGPIADAALQSHVDAALAQLVPAFALRGLASLDFIAANGVPFVLEINPRPSASMALHANAWPGGLMRAHVEAVQGRLPETPAVHPPGLCGTEILFARRAGHVSDSLAAQLAAATDCHDLPAAGTQFAQADPVCSVSAQCATLAAVQQALADRLGEIATQLEPTTTMQESPP